MGHQEAAQERQSERDARYKFIRMPVKCNGVLASETYRFVAGVHTLCAELSERLEAAYIFAAMRTCRVHSIDCRCSCTNGELKLSQRCALASTAPALGVLGPHRSISARR